MAADERAVNLNPKSDAIFQTSGLRVDRDSISSGNFPIDLEAEWKAGVSSAAPSLRNSSLGVGQSDVNCCLGYGDNDSLFYAITAELRGKTNCNDDFVVGK